MFGKKKSGESQDYTRVCDKCGTKRFLPKAWATEKPPSGAQVKSMTTATKFAQGKQRERYSMQSVALNAQQDRVLSNARCPSCGSSDFTQYAPDEVIPE